MNTLNSLKLLKDAGIGIAPDIKLPNFFTHLIEKYYFEFFIGGEKLLFSPFYSLLTGKSTSEVNAFFEDNEELLDQIKEFSLKYLFFFSAVLEENLPYISQPNDIVIFRYVLRSETTFEVKLYAHNETEIEQYYNDKFYIGRSFIDLTNFFPKKMLIPIYLQSVYDQNIKLQERARLKIRQPNSYADELQEINELSREISEESCNHFPDPSRKNLFNNETINLDELILQIIEINEVTVELKEILQDFEMKLRMNNENEFVKNLVKFKKDILNFYQYLHKLFSILTHNRCIS